MLTQFDALPNTPNKDIHDVLKSIIKGDCDFKITNRSDKKKCRICSKPLRVEEKWLLELPMIFTLGFQYPDLDMDYSRTTIRKIYELLQPKLILSKIYKITGGTQSNATYVMRGLIVYYGRHYYAYFYSQKYDTWYQFDDENISSIGNFGDVIEKCCKARAIPRTIFYERQDLIVNMLLDGDGV